MRRVYVQIYRQNKSKQTSGNIRLELDEDNYLYNLVQKELRHTAY